jgi:hypothetical protein
MHDEDAASALQKRAAKVQSFKVSVQVKPCPQDKIPLACTISISIVLFKDDFRLRFFRLCKRLYDILYESIDYSIWPESRVLKSGKENHVSKSWFLEILIMILKSMYSHTAGIAYMFLFLQLLVYGSLLSVACPILVLIFGLFENPSPSKNFWKLLFLIQVSILGCKLFYQLDIFCTTIQGTYSLAPDPSCLPDDAFDPLFLSRKDFVIGISKAPNGNILAYVVFEFLCLLALSAHRFKLEDKGQWVRDGRECDHPDSIFRKRMDKFFSLDTLVLQRCMWPHNLLFKLSAWVSKFTILKYPSNFQKQLFRLIPVDYKNPSNPDYQLKPGKDYYMRMFLFQLVSIIYILLFWGYLGSNSSKLTNILKTTRFPGSMVIFLIIEFCIMVTDRIIYLKTLIFWKICVQVFTVVLYHLFVFSVWPIETDTGFTRNAALVFFYLIKLGYWFTSASQVKDGYIFRGINDNAFTKKANDLNANLITAFYSVPMLFELRTILQWMCVNSSLDW